MKKSTTFIIILVIILILVVPGWYFIKKRPSFNDPPKATFTYDTNATFVDKRIEFDGSGSEGDITRWYWEFGDGNVSSGEFTSNNYHVSDYFDVKLTVTDKNGKKDSTTTKIPIQNVDVNPSNWGSDLSSGSGTALTFYIFEGITEPKVHATWILEADFAVVEIGYLTVGQMGGPEWEDSFILTGSRTVSMVFDPVEIPDDHQMGLYCKNGKLNSYSLEAEVKY